MKIYRPIIKEAWKIAWRNKFLWFFGLLAALLGSGGAYNLGFSNLNKVENYGVWLHNLKMTVLHGQFHMRGPNVAEAWSAVGVSGIFFMLLAVAIFIFLLWLAVSAQAGLAYGTAELAEGRQTNFQAVFKKGTAKFWPVLVLNVIFNFGLLVALMLLATPFFILYMTAANDLLWQSLLIVVSFVVWVPLAIVFAIITRYALFYCVNKGMKVGEALSRAAALFAKNWLTSLEMALLLFFLNIISGLIIAVLMILVALPFVLLAAIAVQFASTTLFWLVVVLGILTFVMALFLYGAVWNVFVMAMWVLLFEKLTKGVVYSKIVRWVNRLASLGSKQALDEENSKEGQIFED